MAAPTRFTHGVGTRPSTSMMGNYPLPDPFHTSSGKGKRLTTYENDFFDIGSAANRTITGSGTTFAIADGLGGVAVLTPGGATTASSAYRTSASWQFTAGYQLWNTTRLKVSSVAGNVSGYFGLIKTGASTTDSLLFVKSAGSTTINLVSTVNSVATTLVSGIGPLVSDTYIDGGFYFDGTDLVVGINGHIVARIANCTIGASGTTLTNAILTPIAQITPVATETVTIDYVLVAQEISDAGVL